jgi:hydroxyacylglutathione hydrolase
MVQCRTARRKTGLALDSRFELQTGKSEPLRVLDVRAAPEWEAGHIRNAQNIYVGHIEEKATEFLPDQPVALICSVGHRAGIAASILQKAGVKEVYNVLGGMTAWQKAGYPVVVESPL